MLHLALDPAHSGDAPAAVALIVGAVLGYLIHCQRQHIRRKGARR